MEKGLFRDKALKIQTNKNRAHKTITTKDASFAQAAFKLPTEK